LIHWAEGIGNATAKVVRTILERKLIFYSLRRKVAATC
jgi:hypothetical protein